MKESKAGRGMPGWLLPAALVLVTPADALGQWRGIDRTDNRIVFAGGLADADREAHRHLRLEDTGGKMEAYEAHWSARRWKVPVLRLRLRMPGRGEVYRSAGRESLEHNVRTHPLFRRLGFAALDAGIGESLLGPVEYLIFEADRFRCVTWRLYLNRGASDEADAIGDTLMTGLYCPRDRSPGNRAAWQEFLGSRDLPEAMLAGISPLNNVRKFAAPVLLLAGTRDRRIPPEHSFELFDLLRAAGRPAELAEYRHAGHRPGPATRERMAGRIAEFLERHLPVGDFP